MLLLLTRVGELTYFQPLTHSRGAAWEPPQAGSRVVSCRSSRGPVLFTELAKALEVQQEPKVLEGGNEKSRGSEPCSELFTYLFSAYNSWVNGQSEGRTKKVPSK